MGICNHHLIKENNPSTRENNPNYKNEIYGKGTNMNHGNNEDSNEDHQEIDQQNPNQENRCQPYILDVKPRGPDSKSSTQKRGPQTSFEIQSEGLESNVRNLQIEDHNKEVMEIDIENSNLKKSDIRKEADLGDRSPHTYSKEELISIFDSLYGWIELLFWHWN